MKNIYMDPDHLIYLSIAEMKHAVPQDILKILYTRLK